MSALLGGAMPQNRIQEKDARIDFEPFRIDLLHGWEDFSGMISFANGYWPGGGGLIGASGAEFGVDDAAIWWAQPPLTEGATARYGIAGVTRDQYGSPLGGCTVKMFKTSTDELVDTQVSDPSGNYTVSSPYYPDAHYLVIYKAGTPDVFGTTPNTLIGS